MSFIPTLRELPGFVFSEPQLSFDETNPAGRVSRSPYGGLNEYGPFDLHTRKFSKIKAEFIYPVGYQDQVETINTVLNRALQTQFRTKLDTSFSQIHNTLCSSYLKKINELSEKTESIFLVYMPHLMAERINRDYFAVKAQTVKIGIPSQIMTRITFDRITGFTPIILALNVYAKYGGIPWSLADCLKKVDMILGIGLVFRREKVVGTHEEKDARFGRIRKFFGYVNIFNKYGLWRFFEGVAKDEVDFKSLTMGLRAMINTSIELYMKEKEEETPPKQLIFHSPKRFSKREISVIQRAMGFVAKDTGIEEDEFNYALLHISDTHPIRAFNPYSSFFACKRGTCIALTPYTSILCTTGETQLPPDMGTPRLLRVRLEYKTKNFKINIFDLSEHVFALSKLNWRSTRLRVRLPVSIMFSRLLADFAAAFRSEEIRTIFRPHAESGRIEVHEKLRRKPWFI
jgi:hypothetical protein